MISVRSHFFLSRSSRHYLLHTQANLFLSSWFTFACSSTSNFTSVCRREVKGRGRIGLATHLLLAMKSLKVGSVGSSCKIGYYPVSTCTVIKFRGHTLISSIYVSDLNSVDFDLVLVILWIKNNYIYFSGLHFYTQKILNWKELRLVRDYSESLKPPVP